MGECERRGDDGATRADEIHERGRDRVGPILDPAEGPQGRVDEHDLARPEAHFSETVCEVLPA